MIDTMHRQKKLAEQSSILQTLGLKERAYAVVTLHRPSNVDKKSSLQKILSILKKINKTTRVVFPIHPRTQKNMERWGISGNGLLLTPPLGYRDFLKLVSHAKLVLTDSGGIQEETTILGIPCLTLRENTERPITVLAGTNVVTGLDPKKILKAFEVILERPHRSIRPPKFWDGKAAERIVKILSKKL
jgi:UDP-N-acetylglucosamine 2-epimerase (non-hydrolysing)